MILTFPDVISVDEQRAILGQIAEAPFVDGRETAGALLTTKHNEQLKRDGPQQRAISDIVLGALRRNSAFLNSTYPNQLHSLLVSRYRQGMRYGPHVDSALMGDATVWRTDLSITLFLNEPHEYDGGELALESGSGDVVVKLPARAIVCYPTGQLHQVREVTRGERLVVVAWIQSNVRDPAAREILRDLGIALDALRLREGRSDVFDRVSKAHTNLLRRWSEP